MARHMRYLHAARMSASKRPTASCMPGPFGRRAGRGYRSDPGANDRAALGYLLNFAETYAELDDDVKTVLSAIANNTYRDLDWEEVENAIMEVEEYVMVNREASNALSAAYDWCQEEEERQYNSAQRAKGHNAGVQDAERTSYMSRRRRS